MVFPFNARTLECVRQGSMRRNRDGEKLHKSTPSRNWSAHIRCVIRQQLGSCSLGLARGKRLAFSACLRRHCGSFTITG